MVCIPELDFSFVVDIDFEQKISCYLRKLMFSKAEGSFLVILSGRGGGSWKSGPRLDVS